MDMQCNYVNSPLSWMMLGNRKSSVGLMAPF